MKKTFFLFGVIFPALPLLALAQPDFESLQRQWVQKIYSDESTAAFYWPKGALLYVNSEVIDFQALHAVLYEQGDSITYQQEKIFEHDQHRYITIGMLKTSMDAILLVSGWRKTGDGWKKEIDILLTLKAPKMQPAPALIAQLDAERKQWVALANKHDPKTHISYSYTSDAVYFGNGQRSDSTSIAERYSYMKNPNYQVDLEKHYVRPISAREVLEVGHYYAGRREENAGGLYLILWQKSDSDRWKIALDFNF